MIEFSHVSRDYGTKTAVADLDLTIPAGELFCLLGPNGAGKTTTIKMATGLLRPSRGTVKLGGFDVTQQTRQAHQITAYVPDEPYLYDKLSGREFLDFIGKLYDLPTDLCKQNTEREIERFSLDGFVDQLTQSYSHGMKQRLAFAAALLHDPQVLVVDEPMVGLDPRSVRLVKDLLRDLADAGAAVLMSTHTLSIAEEIGQRIGVIHQGRLQFVGSLLELRQRQQRDEGSLEELFLEMTNAATDRGVAT